MQFARLAQQPATNALGSGIKRNPEATRRYAAEKGSAEVQRLLSARDCSSLEEADMFLKAALAYRELQRASSRKLDPETGVELDDLAAQRMRRTLATLEKTEPAMAELEEAWARAEQAKSELERAQDLMYEAWGETGERRVELAREALTISKDCADAYVLLGQEAARTAEEARAFFETAVEAGERALGKQAFDEEGFWSRLETRPYMRARASLAGTLWELGEHDPAINHLQELLRLNANDNQGVRYQLVNWLLRQKRYDELGRLLDKFDDDPSAAWAFSRALYLYLLRGESPQADRAAMGAVRKNEHVTPLLSGQKELPGVMPAYVSAGDEDEAVEYVALARESWQHVPGALDWLRKMAEAVNARKRHPAHKLWLNYMESAQRYLEEEQHRKARGQLLYALRQAEKFGEDEFLSKTLNYLVLTSLSIGPAAEDEALCRRAVTLTEELFGSNHLFLATDLHNLGCFYLELNRIQEAEEVFTRAAAIAEHGGDKHLLSSILARLAKVYEAQGKPELASQARRRSDALHDEVDEHECGHKCEHDTDDEL